MVIEKYHSFTVKYVIITKHNTVFIDDYRY